MLAGKAADAAAVDNNFKNSRRSVLMRIHTSLDCLAGNREPQVSPTVLRFHDDSVFILRLADLKARACDRHVAPQYKTPVRVF
jgi:hypothetical protein